MRKSRWALTRDQAEKLEEIGEGVLLALHITAAFLLVGITLELFMQAGSAP
jgi:hypothetical protein